MKNNDEAMRGTLLGTGRRYAVKRKNGQVRCEAKKKKAAPKDEKF